MDLRDVDRASPPRQSHPVQGAGRVGRLVDLIAFGSEKCTWMDGGSNQN